MSEPWDHRDIAAAIRELLRGVDESDPDALKEAVRAFVSEDPGWRQFHPEIVWDVSDAGGLIEVAHGIDELAAFWRDWAGLFESYIPRVLEYRDLGQWVLVPTDVDARGRGGIPLHMRVFQLYQMRDGKVAVMRAFLSETEAVEAAGGDAP
jgi:hypothetical protein